MSKQAPRTQKYLRACAHFVDTIRKTGGLNPFAFEHGNKRAYIDLDREALDAFMAEAQEKA